MVEKVTDDREKKRHGPESRLAVSGQGERHVMEGVSHSEKSGYKDSVAAWALACAGPRGSRVPRVLGWTAEGQGVTGRRGAATMARTPHLLEKTAQDTGMRLDSSPGV